MPVYYVVNESTEDTFGSSDNLEEAIRVARELASRGPAGDPVSIIDGGGMAVQQFVRTPNGTVMEQVHSRRAAS